MLDRLSFAEISLSNYAYNFSKIRKLIKGRTLNPIVMAVVKANAYGHGAVPIAKKALDLGARYLGVVCLYEARELREANIKAPILILNYTDPKSVREALKLKLTLTVMDEEILRIIDKEAKKLAQKAKIHIKVDTGMHRGGALPEEALKLVKSAEKYKNIYLEGVFTHFATSDEKDLSFAEKQLDVFNKLLKSLREKNITPPLIHAANSAATLRLPSAYFDMVRPGVIMYGLPPSHDFKLPFTPRPVMSLKAVIAQIKRLKAGETVGYGRTWKAKRETLMALLPIGYADGYSRALGNCWHVLINGKKAPIIGRISMDQTVADITDIPKVKVGDEAVIIGKQGKEEITADDIARQTGTINYEVVAKIASRVSRVYLE